MAASWLPPGARASGLPSLICATPSSTCIGRPEQTPQTHPTPGLLEDQALRGGEALPARSRDDLVDVLLDAVAADDRVVTGVDQLQLHRRLQLVHDVRLGVAHLAKGRGGVQATGEVETSTDGRFDSSCNRGTACPGPPPSYPVMRPVSTLPSSKSSSACSLRLEQSTRPVSTTPRVVATPFSFPPCA